MASKIKMDDNLFRKLRRIEIKINYLFLFFIYLWNYYYCYNSPNTRSICFTYKYVYLLSITLIVGEPLYYLLNDMLIIETDILFNGLLVRIIVT